MAVAPETAEAARIRRTKWYSVIGVLVFTAVALLLTSRKDRPYPLHFDQVLNIPLPPTDTPYKTTPTIVVIVVSATLGLIGMVWAAIQGRRQRSWLPLVLALSSLAIIVPEVFVDIVGLVWYPTNVHDHAFTIFGRRMGWFIVAGWFSYGPFLYLIVNLLQSRPKTKAVWALWGAAAVWTIPVEELIINYGGCYRYYGNQPLILISKLPWWWIPCNSIGVFLAAAITYRLWDRLQGWRSLVTFFITPMSVTAVYGAIGLPAMIVTNGDYPWLVTQLCGVLTVVLGIFVLAAILKFVLGRNPFDMESVSVFDEQALTVPEPAPSSGHAAADVSSPA